MTKPVAVDAHTHLADPRLEPVLEEVIARSRQAGVTAWVQGGVDPEDWARQRGLVARFPGVVPCFGLHPWYVAAHAAGYVAGSGAQPSVIDAGLEALAAQIADAAGLGELGLDFGKRGPPETREAQIYAFRAQLELAARHSKPLVLHIVQAHEEALGILEKTPPGQGGIVHSFSGGTTAARRYVALGLSISISGGVLKPGHETLKRAVAGIPRESLLLETDSPDQNWAPGLNEAARLLDVARAVSELRGEDPAELLATASANARRVFRLEGLE